MSAIGRSPVLICTGERASYKRLITAGESLSARKNRPLSVLSVQPKELVTPNTAESIQILHNIAYGTGAEITVLFSDSPVLTFAVFAKQINAAEIVVDKALMRGDVVFRMLRDLTPDIPLSVLDEDNQLVTFPPIYEMHTAT